MHVSVVNVGAHLPPPPSTPVEPLAGLSRPFPCSPPSRHEWCHCSLLAVVLSFFLLIPLASLVHSFYLPSFSRAPIFLFPCFIFTSLLFLFRFSTRSRTPDEEEEHVGSMEKRNVGRVDDISGYQRPLKEENKSPEMVTRHFASRPPRSRRSARLCEVVDRPASVISPTKYSFPFIFFIIILFSNWRHVALARLFFVTECNRTFIIFLKIRTACTS